MHHFYLLYLFGSFSTGLLALGIVAYLYAKTRETLLQYYLYFCVPFSLLCASTIWYSYLLINLPTVNLGSLHIVLGILAVSTVFTTHLFMHTLLHVPHTLLKNAIIGGLGAFILTQQSLEGYMMKTPVFPLLGDAILCAVMLYTAIFGLYTARKEPDATRQKLARIFAGLLIAFLPGNLLDMILDEWLDVAPPLFSPLYYAAVSGLLTYHFLKLYGHHHPASFAQSATVATPETVSLEAICTQYALSAREQEVLRLILDGYSNQKIGETLFISLSTVKTHTGNIFQKCSVKSRYELMALFKHARQQPPSS